MKTGRLSSKTDKELLSLENKCWSALERLRKEQHRRMWKKFDAHIKEQEKKGIFVPFKTKKRIR